jgi:hypothetical protein
VKYAVALVLAVAAVACLVLGLLSLANPQDKTGHGSRLFFSLSALFTGAAAGVLVLW